MVVNGNVGIEVEVEEEGCGENKAMFVLDWRVLPERGIRCVDMARSFSL